MSETPRGRQDQLCALTKMLRTLVDKQRSRWRTLESLLNARDLHVESYRSNILDDAPLSAVVQSSKNLESTNNEIARLIEEMAGGESVIGGAKRDVDRVAHD